jgi:hypothetical protein
MFGGAGIAAAVAPVYFFPPVGGWKSDVIHQGFPALPEEIEGDYVSYDNLIMGGTKRYVHLTYAIGTRISFEMINEEKLWLI